MHGGNQIAEVLQRQGVNTVFTLCGGHISPILTGCNEKGIRVVDTRHEATTVFAADAMARLSGIPGVALVTAGPGVTNTITAIKNAQLAQSPIVIIGGATATALKGHGALQDIELERLLKSIVKKTFSVSRVKSIVPIFEKAFAECQSDVPGPVFIECPVDVLYPESLVRELYKQKTHGHSLQSKILNAYLNWHVNRLFSGADHLSLDSPKPRARRSTNPSQINTVVKKLQVCQRPILLVGSQALLNVQSVNETAQAIISLGIPTYLTGMARGLLGKEQDMQLHHNRRKALKEADLVIAAGVPCDFRLNYGSHIRSKTDLIGINLSQHDLKLNRKPNLAIHADPGDFLQQLANHWHTKEHWQDWRSRLKQQDTQRTVEIAQQSTHSTKKINPLDLFQQLNTIISDDAIIIADGGDFVATASYIVKPAKPLSWLDPGVFGTLGVGAGFALAAKLYHPEKPVWIIYGDGALGYSIAEFDTFVRHGVAVIALVGNDASWGQVARDQIEILKDPVATQLHHTDYHHVVKGFGAHGLLLEHSDSIKETLLQAMTLSSDSKIPVLINALLSKSDFRKGSISM